MIRDDETDEIYLVMELMAKALAKGKKLKRDTARQHMRSEPRPALPSAFGARSRSKGRGGSEL